MDEVDMRGGADAAPKGRSFMEAYRRAGVDVEAGYKAVALMRSHIERTARPGVMGGVGGFGGLFSAKSFLQMEEPVLVSGTDGVGTKIQLAYLMDRHDTVGVDCVAMCVNDIICCGAEPLFFLDYIACGRNVPERVEQIVKGVADGCAQAGAALIGGETAEHPDLMPPDEYDLAGFSVGVVERSKIIDGSRCKAGDKLIALASSGAHSNGFSLIRKVFNITHYKSRLDEYIEMLGKTLADELLTPTAVYVKPVLELTRRVETQALAHITGGGLIENLPRVLPGGLKAVVRKSAWAVPPVFRLIAETGGLRLDDLYGTFNMGVGMVAVVRAEEAAAAAGFLASQGVRAFEIGELAAGEGIDIC